ncbi:MAG: S-layer homology domain-containing protein [Ruminococcaceae bacterium]|nr:S-layer homology domain-containing protein [Oscillospiraceae bacterium]
MKKIKNYISIIMAGILLFVSFPSVAEEIVPAENLYLEKAVKVLSALEVIEALPENFQAEKIATRADVVVNTLRLMNVTKEYSLKKQVFLDVPEGYWAFDEINAAYNMKLVSGYKDGLFSPENPMTLSEATKILVSMLGYSSIAEAKHHSLKKVIQMKLV